MGCETCLNKHQCTDIEALLLVLDSIVHDLKERHLNCLQSIPELEQGLVAIHREYEEASQAYITEPS